MLCTTAVTHVKSILYDGCYQPAKAAITAARGNPSHGSQRFCSVQAHQNEFVLLLFPSQMLAQVSISIQSQSVTLTESLRLLPQTNIGFVDYFRGKETLIK